MTSRFELTPGETLLVRSLLTDLSDEDEQAVAGQLLDLMAPDLHSTALY